MKNIVICGGGIIGSSIAYYLSKRNVKSIIIEKSGIACAASGKAGGFLARDWSDETDLQQLSRTSFDLHMDLMKEFPECDYRKMDTLSITVKAGAKQNRSSHLPDWIDGPVSACSVLGNSSTCAQVHPYKLTNTFVEKAKQNAGTEVKIGEVNGLEINEGKVTGVKVNEEVIPAEVVVIAMGPWSGKARDWLNIPKIHSQRAHSIVMQPKKDITAHALFVQFSGKMKSPEVYPRPDGTIYTCGMSDKVALPDNPTDIIPNEKSCEKLKDMCNQISLHLEEAEVQTQQACYLPLSESGVPMLGKLPSVEGAYIAAGHSCWGILNAPATGAAMTELILDGRSTIVDLSQFDPARFLS